MTLADPASLSLPLAELVARANAVHADDPRQAADLLRQAALALPGTDADAAAWVRTSEHVLLAHLDDAASLREALAQVAGVEAPAVVTAVARARQAIAWSEDLDAPLLWPPLQSAEQVRALSTAAAVCLLRTEWASAAARVDRAGRLTADDTGAQRAFAALANNLATDLRSAPQALPPEATALMLQLAQQARHAWARVGGWLEVERADYQLARCHAHAGQGGEALRHAQACLQGCLDHGADAFERFFAHEALLHAHRARQDPVAESAALTAMREMLGVIDDEASRSFAAEVLRQSVARGV